MKRARDHTWPNVIMCEAVLSDIEGLPVSAAICFNVYGPSKDQIRCALKIFSALYLSVYTEVTNGEE